MNKKSYRAVVGDSPETQVGICDGCAAGNKRLTKRTWWTTGRVSWLCAKCQREFGKQLNRPAWMSDQEKDAPVEK